MKRFLLHTVLFLVGGTMIYLPTVWLAGKSGIAESVRFIPDNYGFSDMRLEEADKLCEEGGPEVVFIGSSHCYRTFDTRILNAAGQRCFNLGSSNQTPLQSYYLLKRYLSEWSPELVVIEVHPDIMCIKGNESAVDLLSNTRIDAPMREMALSMKSLQVFNTLLCSLIDHAMHHKRPTPSDKIRKVATQSGDTTVNVDFTYVDGGYVEVTPYCYKPAAIKPNAIEINPDQVEWLKRCLQLLESRSIPGLLVEVPSTHIRYNSYTNHDDFEETIISAAGTWPNYLNLNNDSVLMSQLDDTTCFFDDDHLNQNGAEIFNKFFIKCILSD